MGKPLKKGDLLVKIKPDTYKAILEQQEAAISSAKATNAQQQASMVKADHDMKRAEDMFAKKTISIQELDTARAAMDVAKNTYESSLHMIEQAQASSSQARDATLQNDDLFADRWDDHIVKQQAGRTRGGDEPIRRHRSHARGGSDAHASGGRR